MLKLCIRKSIECVNSKCGTAGEKKLNKWRFNIRSKFRAAGPPYYRNLQVFHVTAVSTEMTCKRSIKTVTRNHYRSPVLATAVTPGKVTPEKA